MGTGEGVFFLQQERRRGQLRQRLHDSHHCSQPYLPLPARLLLVFSLSVRGRTAKSNEEGRAVQDRSSSTTLSARLSSGTTGILSVTAQPLCPDSPSPASRPPHPLWAEDRGRVWLRIMAVRCRRLREISRFLARVLSGDHYVFASSVVLPPRTVNSGGRRTGGSLCYIHKYSTASQVFDHSVREADLVSFIKFSLKGLKGANYHWLNKVEGDDKFLKKDMPSIILVGLLFENSSFAGCNSVIIQKLKSIQQRIPHIYVMGLQLGNITGSPVDHTYLVQLILEDYITFPILVVHKNFSKILKGSSYILLKEFMPPVFYHEEDLDLEIIGTAIKELNNQDNEQSKLFDSSTWILKQNDVQEPYLCSLMQNMLLFSPGCISADETGDRLFVSDSNHHRIIISDGTGKILDCIGSSPGFEDGDFESCKLLRPGATLYDDVEDCLYIVDSENHAIRKADLSRRIIETVFPEGHSNKKSNTLWTWIKNKLGLQKELVVDSETSDTEVLTFPWHILHALDDQVYITSRRFETLWILSSSWELRETVTGFQQVLVVCQELISEKMSLLKQLPHDQLHRQTLANSSLEDPLNLSRISSVTSSGDYIIACDPVGQRVSRLCRKTGAVSGIEFSNFRNLGLPYWMIFPLERVYHMINQSHRAQIGHIQHFSLLPGRVEIKLTVGLPADTELVEPLEESSIWRQARGAATEVLGSQGVVSSSEKVGVAQQWYDELDNLAFTTTEVEAVQCDDNALNTEDDRVHINCVVHTSPGTSEVIINAALYLKLKATQEGNWEKHRENQAARLAELLVSSERRKMGSLCRQILLSSRSDFENLIFVKPLHVRVRIDSRDHPKADNSKDIILSESSIQVDISL